MDVKTIIANNIKPLNFVYIEYLEQWESYVPNYMYNILNNIDCQITFFHNDGTPLYVAKNVSTIEEAIQLCNAHHKARILKEYF